MTQPAPERARMLVVDDEPGVLHATVRVLEGVGEVRGAGSGAEARAIARAFRPGLLVTDIRMPGQDGFALAGELRVANPDLDVIFMTGSRSEPDAHMIRAIQEQAFYFIQKPFDRRVLTTLVSRCLELRRLRRAERAYTAHLEGELQEARLFQRAMLAPESGTLAGVRVDARCLPCQELGGDLYDYAQAPDGRLAFVVADVRGHGASAAMFTAIVKSVFHAPAHAYEPGRVAEALAAAVTPFGDDRFITAFCGLIDATRRELVFVGAGHPAALLWAAGDPASARWIRSESPILCSAFPQGSWAPASAILPERWRLLLHTDGLTDALPGSSDEQRRTVFSAACAHPSEPALLCETLVQAAITGAAQRRADGQLPDDVSTLVLSQAAGS